MPTLKPIEIKIEDCEIGNLSPNPWNSNVVAPENEAKLDISIKRFGLFKPILCRQVEDESLEIIGGQHRWEAAKRAGYKTVPIINLGPLTDIQAKEISLVDNGRYGEDDTLQLADVLKSLGSIDELSTFLPMNEDDFGAIFSSMNIALDALDIPENEVIPDLNAPKVAQTHQLMRFKVPVEDAHKVTELINQVIKEQKFTQEDSLANAGNALVHLLHQTEKR